MLILPTCRRFFFSFLILSSQLTYAADDLLEEEDVSTIMREILSYHVEENAMTSEIIQRSLKVYIDQFDINKTYLLEEEVAPFLNPSPQKLRRAVKKVQKGDLSDYFKLNAVVQKAIRRSRVLRNQIEQDKEGLFATAVEEDDEKDPEEIPWAEDEEELKDRLREQMEGFIAFQKKTVGVKGIKGKEQKVIDLYERNLRSEENKYLYVDDEGDSLSYEQRQHFFTLHVLRAMARGLDSHTAFFSYAEAYDMKVRLEKGFEGVGIVLQDAFEGVAITRLIEGGPAEKSGKIEENDRIISVDGQSIVDYSFDRVLDFVRGEEGTAINLGISRLVNETEEQFEVELVREKIEIIEDRVDTSSVPFGDGIIGRITLHSFYDGDGGVSSVRDVRSAIRELQDQGDLKGLVLDLRENTGGFLMQAVKVAGLFITNGVVVVSKYGDGEIRYFRDIDGHAYYDGPLVVLTSRGSASAAEIVAQTLQEYGSAIIVGDERTYGKGSIQHQTITDANSSSYFKVTVGRYYTVSGSSTQIQGVKADIVVPTVLNQEELGEEFLDYALTHDYIEPVFDDQLIDLEVDAQRWYRRYYLPTLQSPVKKWRKMLPVLKKNSAYRLENNDNFHEFLEALGLAEEDDEEEMQELKLFEGDPQEENYGVEDLQLREAINIVKDMIFLQISSQAHVFRSSVASGETSGEK